MGMMYAERGYRMGVMYAESGYCMGVMYTEPGYREHAGMFQKVGLFIAREEEADTHPCPQGVLC